MLVGYGARRLAGMVENAFGVVGIELLAAAAIEPARLEAVRQLVRSRVPTLYDDRYFHPDLVQAIELVRSGQVAEAAGADTLPSVS